jgi:hypothetical protein
MSQFINYNHDDRDHDNNSDMEDTDRQPSESDTEEFDDTTKQSDSEDANRLPDDPDDVSYNDWEYQMKNNKSRSEVTFGPKETTALPNEVVANEIKPDPDLISYGTNFDMLLARDPVHVHMLDLVVEYATDPQIILYTKMNLVKLAAINKAKAGSIEDAELASMMASVKLAHNNGSAERKTQRHEESVIRDCIDQIHSLNKTSNLQMNVHATLRNIIKTSRYILPGVIGQNQLDDLCGVLYAILSDNHYKNASTAATINNLPQTGQVIHTTSALEPKNKSAKHVPKPGVRFGIKIITHLTLIGGLPIHSVKLHTTSNATFKDFTDKISGSVKSSRLTHRYRLGYLTDEQMGHGKWLYQIATGMETLDLERTAWGVVDENSYEMLSSGENEHIFLMHVSLTESIQHSQLCSPAP